MTDKHQETVVKPQPSPPSDHTVIQSVRQAQIKVPPIPTIQHMVQDAFDSKASDIHIRVGEVPRFRINGKIYPTKGYPKIKKDLFNSFLGEALTLSQRKQLAQKKELDTAIFYPGLVRCRLNCFDTLTGGAMVIRLISLKVPTIDQLNLPPIFKEISCRQKGLIIVSGPTGSGKSTTIAAMLNHVNQVEQKHIITVEDPIEFIHSSQRSLISQREVGLHTYDFQGAIRSALREDPDVIMVGEMRDRFTVNSAIRASQTGHVVFGTLHTHRAYDVINRLVSLYNADEQEPMRLQIADSITAIIAQTLVTKTDGNRIAVHDILVNTPAMRDYLIQGRKDDILQMMEDDTFDGMQVMNQAIYDQLLLGTFSLDEARLASPEPAELDRIVRQGGSNNETSARNWMMKK
ncbi:MAG: PilT/PilU family type 4a pilus ATPase [Synechococcaceae cyanobacterium RL_1_2]|nr:PilT/PilU family type 4a pilus ATPase [Synechococcaceae cyanobacterium RL_1_2]